MVAALMISISKAPRSLRAPLPFVLTSGRADTNTDLYQSVSILCTVKSISYTL